MGGREKLVKALAVVEIVAALLIVLMPRLVFPVCEAPMHCYYSYMAEIGLAAVIAGAGVLTLLLKGMLAARVLSFVTAIAGLFAVLYPSVLIGVCGSPRMPCHYGLLPVWNLLGGLVIMVSLAVFIASRGEKV
jgi:hypothetical protein